MCDASQREWRVYIDDETLWSINRDDAPELRPLLEALKNASRP